MKETLFIKMLPLFSLVMFLFWGYELWTNYKASRTDRVVLDAILCIAFLIGFIGSIVLKKS